MSILSILTLLLVLVIICGLAYGLVLLIRSAPFIPAIGKQILEWIVYVLAFIAIIQKLGFIEYLSKPIL
jgi:hypothetical protein